METWNIPEFTTKNIVFNIVALLISFISVCYIQTINLWWSVVILGVVYLYIIFVLLSACILSSKTLFWVPFWIFWMPSRVGGLVLFVCFLVTVIYCWANIYLVIGNQFRLQLLKPLDAVYFSYITTATIGYGDIVPVSDLAKRLVMLQISGSILLFFGGFPLLISRLSTFKN